MRRRRWHRPLGASDRREPGSLLTLAPPAAYYSDSGSRIRGDLLRTSFYRRRFVRYLVDAKVKDDWQRSAWERNLQEHA